MVYVLVLSVSSNYSGYIYLASVTYRADNQKEEMEEGTVCYSYFAGTDLYECATAENGGRAMVWNATVHCTYKYGIVPGRYSFWDWERNRPEFSEVADRLTEKIRLYKCERIEKLVLASDGSIIQSKDGKGLQGNPQGMMKYLNELGIPKEDIIMETFANNTRENVTFTKKLLGKEMDTASVVIITSAVHMKRSVSAFQAEGIYPDCYITDPWVDVKGQRVSFMPSVGTLARWPELLHEWVGYIVYKFLYS